MSKSKGNTVDPFDLFDKYGADATRWYLLYSSPVWAPTKFDEEGLKEVVGKFFGTLRNVYNFFVLYANLDNIDPRDYNLPHDSRPELDRWILSRYNRLIQGVIEEMDRYDHMKTVRKIQHFVVEDLSNWYIRRARRRFWADGLTDDKKSVYAATWEILTGIAKLTAPLTPFISDEIFMNLTGGDSVHLALYPEVDASCLDDELEERMELVRGLVTLGRGAREKERIKVRQPLNDVLVDGKLKEKIGDMTALIMEELNVRNIVFEDNLEDYMDFALKPNFKIAGPVLGGKIKDFAAVLRESDAAVLNAKLSAEGYVMLDIGGDLLRIEKDFVEVKISAREGFTVAMENDLFVILDVAVTDELLSEGLAREFVSKIQQLRKQQDFEMMDQIDILFSGGEMVAGAVNEHREYIMKETLALSLTEGETDAEGWDLNGYETRIQVARR
jgi:isoleucyl-tRNA synthetase